MRRLGSSRTMMRAFATLKCRWAAAVLTNLESLEALIWHHVRQVRAWLEV